jgi:hypothetical protein
MKKIIVIAVLCKTCSVLLYVLEQPRVDNSSTWPLTRGAQLVAIGLIALKPALNVRTTYGESRLYGDRETDVITKT